MTGIKIRNRWLVVVMGTVLQLTLGTVYAWSFFQKPLVLSYGWTNSQVAWTFSIAICFLGFAAAWGGIQLPKLGPRRLASLGSLLYATGFFLAALALHSGTLILLYLGFGVIGGIGLGLGYVTPVATVAKWFPDKKGFATGMVVMGFGFGALVLSKLIAPYFMNLFSGELPLVFAAIGAVLLVLSILAAQFMVNPPEDTKEVMGASKPVRIKKYLGSGKFIIMWLIFFFNISAGIMFISFQSPMLQKLLTLSNPQLTPQYLAATGATLIAISSLFNGLGRFFWGSISDKIGRIGTFRLLLGTQTFVFIGLLFISNPVIFALLVCYILLCYGGGFGTMPSFISDEFGSEAMAYVYGAILTAWSAGGIAGPQIVAILEDRYPMKASMYAFTIGGMLLISGFLVSFFMKKPRFP